MFYQQGGLGLKIEKVDIDLEELDKTIHLMKYKLQEMRECIDDIVACLMGGEK